VKLRVRMPRFPRASRRFLIWGGVVVVSMALGMLAPLALRRLSFFRVRQVELVGIRYLGADAVLTALRLAPRTSVFDDTRALVQRVRALDGVADASVVRRLPGSLKIIVREVEPVALVTAARGALRIVDGCGRTLPYDPTADGATGVGGIGGGIDLPVVQAADSGLIGVLARIQALDPVLFQSIDAARATNDAGGSVVLELGVHRVVLARDAGPEVIEAVVLVARDLEAKARRYTELDARYAGQIVVRRRGTRSA
jgi:cell division septal protein FtsQ